MTENVFVENYFDTFSDKLIAVRILTGDVLLKHRAYEIQYRGPLPKEPKLNKKTWKQVETGMERQIFDLSNVFRHYFGKPALRWDDTVREVAYLHSKDMAVHDYFSHYRLDGQGLKERLAEKDVFYLTAGENIAAQYPDAPAAVLGWLNSVGHREALLEKNYTHLGVGVYQFHYTQNFLNKP
ncbi:CAP domain-containing protein [Paracerasibacillus soli]|uniref:CAP domain-containing protein n=1 Tax=Paracerasibacillus soli TaxID=480284 RepID=A0ABU5CNZ0_9BACI|nr:CAP domain-containing protein [Virgibacillus soli]MDY0408079.1 CAP domain-containing protein [Virgibacillus soli]